MNYTEKLEKQNEQLREQLAECQGQLDSKDDIKWGAIELCRTDWVRTNQQWRKAKMSITNEDEVNVSAIHLGNHKRHLLDLFIVLTENKIVPDNTWMREEWEERQKTLGTWFNNLGIYGISKETRKAD